MNFNEMRKIERAFARMFNVNIAAVQESFLGYKFSEYTIETNCGSWWIQFDYSRKHKAIFTRFNDVEKALTNESLKRAINNFSGKFNFHGGQYIRLFNDQIEAHNIRPV